MKTIVVINDSSAEAEHAAELALSIAQMVNADLLIANVFKENTMVKIAEYVLVAAGADSSDMVKTSNKQSLLSKLMALNCSHKSDFTPQISDFDASGFTETNMAQFIIKNNIWMMAKGMKENIALITETRNFDIQCVLNRVMCPLLLVPAKYQLKGLERIVYMADLRYCQLPVVKCLANIARPCNAKLQIAHISIQGLPDMEENYARSFFSEVIGAVVNYDQLFFNNIKEKDIQKVVDVMIHGLSTDLLVLINHQFHFEQIIGRYITGQLPENITVPLLIFPG
ncbi:hypothetical protein [Mucilaginibacter sp.]|uniref:hypothetical protein n=1 Tax=Mucilaginibacter sp. TaxID=1882438 RepID=UPI00284017CC|nr:hypothetical protein [Mucilaginibacter sp.]MDR3697406.1 hypothetical protein [Mucilaginibacter sp.]